MTKHYSLITVTIIFILLICTGAASGETLKYSFAGTYTEGELTGYSFSGTFSYDTEGWVGSYSTNLALSVYVPWYYWDDITGQGHVGQYNWNNYCQVLFPKSGSSLTGYGAYTGSMIVDYGDSFTIDFDNATAWKGGSIPMDHIIDASFGSGGDHLWAWRDAGGVLREESFSGQGAFTKFEQIPKPTTMLLLGAGLVGLAGFGRKRFKK
jgi:hypothetical protein